MKGQKRRRSISSTSREQEAREDYELNEGMTKIGKQSKRLIIVDTFDWSTEEAIEQFNFYLMSM